jgi:hypothetical protein
MGMIGYAVALPGFSISGVTFDAHTLLVSSLAILLGFQSCVFAVLAKTFAIGEKILPEDRRLTRFYEVVTLERGLMVGLGAFLAGLVLLLVSVNQWRLANFGDLDYARTMRCVIPGVTLAALGFQGMLASFFSSILRLRRR